MRKAALLPVIIIGAVVVGGLLYLYGGPEFHPSQLPTSVSTDASSQPSASQPLETKGDISILAQGQNADGVQQRVNYRITNADQLATLWELIYSSNGPAVPSVDFSKKEVLAVFDGTHTTSGFGVIVSGVHDADGVRTVSITHTAPGDSCVPGGGVTSPFMLVVVPKTSLPLSHDETTQVNECE
jgi:hypothetical protein